MNKSSYFILAFILVLAIFLRIFRLDQVPSSLFGDEVDVGYQAYSILHTGKDLAGNFLPVYFRSLSEYRTPLYLYSAVPFVAVFGLNEWGIRLPAVFWGLVSIIGIFLLTRKLYGDRVGIIAAFLMAISPWHLQYSRASFEVTMLLTFIIFGIYFFLKEKKYLFFLILSLIFFGLSIYIYSTAIIFSPLILGLLVFLNYKDLIKRKTKLLLPLIIITIIILPAVWFVFKGAASERFGSVSIFRDSVLDDKINLARKSQEFITTEGRITSNNPSMERIFHNKPTVYAQVFTTNYLKAFSLDFLFANGDINFRHSIHEMGELYYFELILLSLGLLYLIKNESLKTKTLIFAWLLLAPVPASLTSDGGYHATRLILMLPPLIIINSLGALLILNNLKRNYVKALLTVVVILFAFNFIFYIHRYFVHYPVESWRWWHSGFKEAMLYMKDNEENYSKLVFNNTYEPVFIRFLTWWQFPPEQLHLNYSDILKNYEVLPGIEGFRFKDKYYFGSAKDKVGVNEVVKGDMMYLVSARDEVPGDWDWEKNPPSGIKVLKTIRNPEGLPIFFVVTAND